MEPMIGHVVKGYELREAIGAGSYGAVYRGYQLAIRREVAIKVILPQYANQPDFIRRFEVEAQFIARLEHPHIVPLYDYWRDPTGAYLVMRWLRGSLRMALQRAPWTLEATARLLDQIAPALTSAHREGVVHRDLKPENILLDEDANAYLADFGIAMDVYLRAQLAANDASLPVESVEYLSPEELRGEEITPRSDLYSLGYVLYEMLTGQKPFLDATTSSDYRQRHLRSALPMMSIQHSHVPAAVDEVLQTATAKDPTHRYASALRLAAAFRAALPAATQPRIPAQPLADALTERELEVLDLIVAGLSNMEIAERLFVTAGTVKWYAKQIYSKLDVHSRHQAIERAERIGLLRRGTQRPLAPPAEPIRRDQLEPESLAAAPENPYKGLRAFQEADAADFFGRAGMTERLLSRLSEKGDSSRFLVIVGPSGSGKSSLVRAGLLPALRGGALASSPHPFIADLLPGTHPLEELEAALLRVAVNPVPRLIDQLREDRRGLARAARQVLPNNLETELIVLVDQFEEVFTLTTDEEMRTQFIDNLLSAATDPRGRVRVILTLRADFYDRPLQYPRLAELVRAGTEVVVPLIAREMEQAITAPAERAGLRLEAGLVSTILKDVGEQPGTLPLLQYALTELFERREGVMLTIGAYQAMNGVKGAITRRADDIYVSLDEGLQALARQMVLRMVTLGYGTEDIRRRVLLAELNTLDEESAVEDVINAFADFRLITLDRDPITRGPTVEIAHEALLREWEPLRLWLNESREDIHLQRQLSASAHDWRAAGREESFLLRGARLERFDRWAEDTTLALTPDERGYLAASRATAEQEQRAEAERRERETWLQRRSQRFLRALVAVLLLATVIAVILSALATSNARDADEQRALAVANAQEAEAERANVQVALATSDANFARAEQQRLYLRANEAMDNGATGNVGMALALRSLAYGYTPDADAALLRASRQGMLLHTLPGHQFELYSVAYSPDGAQIATSSEGGIYLYDAATGEQTHFLPDDGIVQSAVYSSDGATLLTSVFGPEVSLWNTATGALIRRYPIDAVETFYAYFTPDGSRFVVFVTDGYQVYDLATGALLENYPAQIDGDHELIGLAYMQGGRLLFPIVDTDNRVYLADSLTGDSICTLLEAGTTQWKTLWWSDRDPIVVLGTDEPIAYAWDLTTCTPLGQFTGHTARIGSVDYDSGAGFVVTGDDSGVAYQWDIQTGHELGRFVNKFSILTLDISPDGGQLLMPLYNIGGVWDLTFPQQPRAISTGQDGQAAFPRFAPDGKSVYIGAFGAYSHWDLSGDTSELLMTYEQPIRIMDISPDGRYLFAAVDRDLDYSLNLIDAETGETLRQYVGHTRSVNIPGFSPDGSSAVSGSFDMTARIWDVATSETLHILRGHTGVVSSASFAPDGTLVLTTSSDGTVRLWDAATGEVVRVIDVGAPVPYASFSPDGSLIAAADAEGFGHVVETATGEELHTLTGHTDTLWSAKFSPDGAMVVTASWDSTARIWDTQTGVLLRVLDNPDTNALDSAEFSPDGEVVLTGPQGDDRAFLWSVDLDSVIADFCARPLAELTPDQRVQYGIDDDALICP